MADDARTQFIDGLRVSAEHLQHMQDRLREAVLDVRTSLGLGRVAWGLRVTLSGDSVELSPGLAFAPSGVRLAVDAPRRLAVPAGDGTFAVVLRAEHGDREPLRFNGVPTVLTLGAHAEVGDAPAASEEEALVVATVTRAGGALTVVQDDALFVATGAHRHTGAHVQDSDGRWRFDGVAIAGGGGGGVGGVGPKGDPGPAGPAGATGPEGPAGATGPEGPGGPVGVAGPAGAQGEPGAAGTPGAAGPAGEVGPAGPLGPKGDSGIDGAAGQPGPQGAEGPKGDKGDSGDVGISGPAGAPGTQGIPGPQGPLGPEGLQGAVGPAGPRGADGLGGPPGADGAELDQDWGVVRKISWPHDGSLPASQALQVLQGGLQVTLSRSLDQSVQATPQQVMQVWFEPDSTTTAETLDTPLPIATIVGKLRVTPQTIAWLPSVSPTGLRLMVRRGRILVRLHCGMLIDAKQKQFSASVAPLFGTQGLIMPGGVFESWFFIE